jgi:hypothetical protein
MSAYHKSYTLRSLVLRLYRTQPIILCITNKANVLPRGRGPDGTSPVHMPKGAGTISSVYHLHWLESVHGPEARVFRLERWKSGEFIKKARPGAGHVDFNGDSGLCLGSR